jgi:hypothetical protein
VEQLWRVFLLKAADFAASPAADELMAASEFIFAPKHADLDVIVLLLNVSPQGFLFSMCICEE